MRVLVVDDDRAVREALRRTLTLAGYDVQVAEDGERALEQIVRAVPDAVVLDVGLPGIDGLEVCRRVRPYVGNRVPILILTARDAVADRIDGLDVGADDYMVKPFDVGELKARLRALLRRAKPEADDPRRAVLRGAAAGPHTPRGAGGRELRGADANGVSAAGAADAQPAAWCCRTASSTTACGAMTSARRRTRCACTSATCAASSRMRARAI